MQIFFVHLRQARYMRDENIEKKKNNQNQRTSLLLKDTAGISCLFLTSIPNTFNLQVKRFGVYPGYQVNFFVPYLSLPLVLCK